MSSYTALARFYDSLTGDVPYAAMADYYERVFARRGVPVKTVLDLACGTGTMTRLLAERGYDMIGADASGEMLSVAAEKTFDLPVRPLLLCQPMERLDLYGTVDAVICALDGINYAPPDKLPEIFRRVRLFLEPGGVFIFDIHTPSKLRGLDGEVFIDETEDVFCVWRAEFDIEENACCYGMDIFARDGRKWTRSREEHTEYAYESSMVEKLLLEAGFEQAEVCGDMTHASPTEADQRLFISAVKPK
ncbi:Methyltransferase domain-containing protein [Sporobacter termitidis DSM 10068]|uniref:Methyltransferase domain-containing protein n=1 Tax=Sporobacter termitidis DSM 10068 TaxID=1123282 RepID=A0A1M5TNT6_9FIRM|nr:class I SAM-dependent methyltransferase [Sporobacter termitidis]SHH52422.1 Methyltransferase domain-containing protein [Sporobacter termitidis DSM 10068]